MSRPPCGLALVRASRGRLPPVWVAALRDPDIGGLSYALRLQRRPLSMAVCHPERFDEGDGLCSACACDGRSVVSG